MSILDEFAPGFRSTISGPFNTPDLPSGSAVGSVQRHHLIPSVVANESDLLRFLKSPGLPNGVSYYSHNDFLQNGMFLPVDAKKAHAAGFARHSSNHEDYRGMVGRVLKEIEEELEGRLSAEVTSRLPQFSGDRANAIASIRNDGTFDQILSDTKSNVRGLQEGLNRLLKKSLAWGSEM